MSALAALAALASVTALAALAAPGGAADFPDVGHGSPYVTRKNFPKNWLRRYDAHSPHEQVKSLTIPAVRARRVPAHARIADHVTHFNVKHR